MIHFKDFPELQAARVACTIKKADDWNRFLGTWENGHRQGHAQADWK